MTARTFELTLRINIIAQNHGSFLELATKHALIEGHTCEANH